MRWDALYTGQTRVRSGFLIFPKQLDYEWRWLEHATWEEEYDGWSGFWKAKEWIDSEETTNETDK